MSFELPVTAAEADLERLLSIEPSAGFRARVRERVASESTGRRSWPSLIALVHAGALMAVALALVMPSRDAARPAPPAAPRLFATAVHRPDAVPLMTTPRPVPTPQAARRQPAPRVAREPEVVWDVRGADAIARVIELGRRGTIITAPKAPEANPLAVQPLSVVPIVIDALMPSTGSERSSS
jgi:hypothetical protein